MAVTKLSELPLITSTLNDDLVYLVRDGTSNRVTVETLIHNLANTSISGNISFASTDFIYGYGNIDINTTLTFLDSQNVPENIVLLPDGAEGQLKIISLWSTNGGNTYVQGNFNPPGQRLVFNTIGDSSLLVYALGRWNMISVTQPYVSASTFNSVLNTANVVEVSPNLYFSNARARYAIEAIDNTIDYNRFTGTIRANVSAIARNANTTDVLPEGQFNKYYSNARVAVFIQPFLTTANVRERSSNLYFTNQRAIDAVSPLLDTANVSETAPFFYATNNRVRTLLSSGDATIIYNSVEGTIRANLLNVAAGIGNTDLIVEGPINKYFSNTRARQAFTPGLNIVIEANGRISATSQVSFTGNTDIVPEGEYNLYYTDSRVVGAATPVLTTANVVELTNLYFTNERAIAAVGGGLTTANIAEAPENLYFTNNRVRILYSAGNNITIEANGRISSTASGTFSGNTDLVAEGVTNQYFTSARAINAVNPRLTTANVLELTNLYFTNSRVVSAIVAGNNITIEANGRISSAAAFTGNTNGVPEGTTNLYFTNARVISTVTPTLTTANVRETSANLYFTNSRVVSALIAGNSITIEANGRISSTASFTGNTNGVPEGTTNLYFTNARAVVAVSTNMTTANVREVSSNLYYTNARVLASLTTTNVRVGSLSVGTDPFVENGSIRVSGNVYVTYDVYSSYSDERLKDVKGEITSALDKLKTLTGFIYTPNELAKSLGFADKQDVGVSAQKVQAIQPEAIGPAGTSGDYLTVKYERLIPLIIEAIKELDKKIDDLGK